MAKAPITVARDANSHTEHALPAAVLLVEAVVQEEVLEQRHQTTRAAALKGISAPSRIAAASTGIAENLTRTAAKVVNRPLVSVVDRL